MKRSRVTRSSLLSCWDGKVYRPVIVTLVTGKSWDGRLLAGTVQPLDATCMGAWHTQPAQPAIRREGFVSPVGARTTAQSQSGHVSTYMICMLAYRHLRDAN
jgi:hypothetical protein